MRLLNKGKPNLKSVFLSLSHIISLTSILKMSCMLQNTVTGDQSHAKSLLKLVATATSRLLQNGSYGSTKRLIDIKQTTWRTMDAGKWNIFGFPTVNWYLILYQSTRRKAASCRYIGLHWKDNKCIMSCFHSRCAIWLTDILFQLYFVRNKSLVQVKNIVQSINTLLKTFYYVLVICKQLRGTFKN